jgi:ABC-type glycerol-3-phosphate transport system permease component
MSQILTHGLLERVPARVERRVRLRQDTPDPDLVIHHRQGTDLGQMSAVTLLIIVPIVLFVLLAQRLLVRGLTLGAVKQ